MPGGTALDGQQPKFVVGGPLLFVLGKKAFYPRRQSRLFCVPTPSNHNHMLNIWHALAPEEHDTGERLKGHRNSLCLHHLPYCPQTGRHRSNGSPLHSKVCRGGPLSFMPEGKAFYSHPQSRHFRSLPLCKRKIRCGTAPDFSLRNWRTTCSSPARRQTPEWRSPPDRSRASADRCPA